MDQPLGPEDTFNRLRRASYSSVCAEYVKIIMRLPMSASKDAKIRATEDMLKSAGWTYQELMDEHMRTRNIA